MAFIEGVIASARTESELTVLTVFPIAAGPSRRLVPEDAVELVLRREPWQTDESHRDHAQHMVGRGGRIEYAEGGNVIDLIRSH